MNRLLVVGIMLMAVGQLQALVIAWLVAFDVIEYTQHIGTAALLTWFVFTVAGSGLAIWGVEI